MLDDLVHKYIVLRDKRDSIANAAKEKCAKINDALKVAEAAMLAEFQKSGAESVRTPSGTAYKTTRTSATVGDWDAILEFIQENDAWYMLDKRVNKTGVEQYRQENNDLPPGVKWVEDITINVRRS
jgi:hypothetical protein